MNVKNISTLVMTLVLALVLAPGCHVLRAAEPTPQPRLQDPKACDATLAVSTAAAMAGLKNKSLVLVDVRPSSEFAKYHIPGSLNIALHAIKTKPYLKAKPIVLANEGYALAAMENTCNNLNAAGFKAKILEGGILAWKIKGGEVVGDPFAMTAINQVTPQSFLREKDYSNHLAINATPAAEHSGASLPPGVIPLPLLESKKAVKELKKMIRKSRSEAFSTLLVFTATGKENPRIQRLLAAEGIRQVFFLEGGLQAYGKHLQHNLLARQPKSIRKRSTGGCSACTQE